MYYFDNQAMKQEIMSIYIMYIKERAMLNVKRNSEIKLYISFHLWMEILTHFFT